MILAKGDIVYFDQEGHLESRVSVAPASRGYCRHTDGHLVKSYQLLWSSMDLVFDVDFRRDYLELWRCRECVCERVGN